jgi:subtilisin family serine protease
MTSKLGALALIAVISACSGAPATTTPAPAPAPTPTPAPAPKPPQPAPEDEASPRDIPANWHLLDARTDSFPGISLLRAERELLQGRTPARTVVVAVIDNGVDTAHAALRSRLWSNPRETPGNGRDDDNNGFTDDVYGWNLIGGPDGRNVDKDTYEVARLAAQCTDSAQRARMVRYRDECPAILAELQDKRQEAEQILGQVRQIEMLMSELLPYLRRATGSDTPSVTQVRAIQTSNDTVRQARQIFLSMDAQGITPEVIADAKKTYAGQLEFSYNPSFDPRPIVGDNYPDTTVKRYGNRDVAGPGPEHGTHVAGIIAALRDSGGTGIAGSVRVMALRAVPDGDERDKDVANAIRYAVDNGAHIINMSFGKGWSPWKQYVDDAVRYADSRGVLLVHGAGNDGENVDSNANFPSPGYLKGGRARNWIEVGATSWHAGDSLVAPFSNFGAATVDVFAPGVDIYSTVPGGKFKKQSGTSMASPVVAGVAALLMSYFPNLTAADVRRIILETATRMPDHMVVRPGEGEEHVRFGDLSVTGGIVNAFAAVQAALARQP